MKFYTVINAALAALVGTASSAHAAATTTLNGEEEAPNLRRIAIDEKDEEPPWKPSKPSKWKPSKSSSRSGTSSSSSDDVSFAMPTYI